MSLSPEENLLDESLRDAFHDYHLPAAGYPHVWAGVEKRIAHLPGRPATFASRLVLPLTAALGVGVAVGWLLPHPATPPPPPKALPTVQATTWTPHATATAPVSAAVVAQVSSQPVPAAAPAEPAAISSSYRNQPRTAAILRPRRMAEPAVGTVSMTATSDSVVLADTQPALAEAPVATATVATDASSESVVTAMTPAVPAPNEAPAIAHGAAARATPAAPEQAATHFSKTAKPEPMLYRKPTHRQPERGVGGFRRWVSHLGQSIRHIL